MSLNKKKKFVDNAFVSVTNDINVAITFSKRKLKGGVIEISGVKNLAVKTTAYEDESWGESEYLLPRGLTYEIIGRKNNLIKVKVVS